MQKEAKGLAVTPDNGTNHRAGIIDLRDVRKFAALVITIGQNKPVVRASRIHVESADDSSIIDRGACSRGRIWKVDLCVVPSAVAQESVETIGLCVDEISHRTVGAIHPIGFRRSSIHSERGHSATYIQEAAVVPVGARRACEISGVVDAVNSSTRTSVDVVLRKLRTVQEETVGHAIGRGEGTGDRAAIIDAKCDSVKRSGSIEGGVLPALDQIREGLELLPGQLERAYD